MSRPSGSLAAASKRSLGSTACFLRRATSQSIFFAKARLLLWRAKNVSRSSRESSARLIITALAESFNIGFVIPPTALKTTSASRVNESTSTLAPRNGPRVSSTPLSLSKVNCFGTMRTVLSPFSASLPSREWAKVVFPQPARPIMKLSILFLPKKFVICNIVTAFVIIFKKRSPAAGCKVRFLSFCKSEEARKAKAAIEIRTKIKYNYNELFFIFREYA